jgi:5'-methylthioadenosine phosphorylase
MKLGIVGGTAFEDPGALLDGAQSQTFTTGGRPVTFYTGTLVGTAIETVYVQRHGTDHELPPHRVPYGSHAVLMRDLGVDAVLGTAICGSLREELPPGSVVLPDQIVDLTGRRGPEGVRAEWLHLPFGEPYCPHLRARAAAIEPANATGFAPAGCITTIGGPRFASRAEARWLAAQDWDLVNMTQATEAYAFRQAELCYVCVAFVTDYAYGLDFSDDAAIGTSMGKTLEMFRSIVRTGPHHLARIGQAITTQTLGSEESASCRCRRPMPAEYYKEASA